MITIEDFEAAVRKYFTDGYLKPRMSNLITLDIIEKFSEDNCDAKVLKKLANFLTVDSFTDLLDERKINNVCGYPLCDKPPKNAAQKSNPTRALSDHLMVHNNISKANTLTPYSYLNNYCSKEHFQCCKFYKSQLSNNALFLRKNPFEIDQKVILLEEVWSRQEKENQSLVDILQSLEITKFDESDPYDKNDKTAQPVLPEGLLADRIVEKEADMSMDVDDSFIDIEERAKGIEGYVTKSGL